MSCTWFNSSRSWGGYGDLVAATFLLLLDGWLDATEDDASFSFPLYNSIIKIRRCKRICRKDKKTKTNSTIFNGCWIGTVVFPVLLLDAWIQPVCLTLLPAFKDTCFGSWITVADFNFANFFSILAASFCLSPSDTSNLQLTFLALFPLPSASVSTESFAYSSFSSSIVDSESEDFLLVPTIAKTM